MGSYSKSIVQDLRTVVEGAEKVATPESLLAEPLSFAVKSDEAIWGKISAVMPGAIQAGGNVTVQEITPEIIEAAFEYTGEQLERSDVQVGNLLERTDLWIQALVGTVVKSAEEQTKAAESQAKSAIAELGETTRQISEERVAEIEAKQGIFAIPKNAALLLGGGLVLFLAMKGR